MTLKEAKLRLIEKYLDVKSEYNYYYGEMLKKDDYYYYSGCDDEESKQLKACRDKLDEVSSYYYMIFNRHVIDDIRHYSKLGVLDDRGLA